MLITRACTRISLVGGGTDYNSVQTSMDGVVISMGITQYAYIMARFLPPYHDHKTRVVYSEIETVPANNLVKHRAINACMKFMGFDQPDSPGLEVFHASDVPSFSGLGSSSAFVVGLLHALNGLQQKMSLPMWLATSAIRVEQDLMGECVGKQDQVAAAYGGLNIIRFRRSGAIDVEPLLMNHELLLKHLLLFFTRQSRTSSQVAATYAPKLNERGSEMWELLHLTDETIDALTSDNYPRLGEIIDRSWRIKASLSPSVSNDRLAKLYATARVAGAWGGKVTGSGGGGCILTVCPPEKRQRVIEAMEAEGAVHIPFRIDWEGSKVIFADSHSYTRTAAA